MSLRSGKLPLLGSEDEFFYHTPKSGNEAEGQARGQGIAPDYCVSGILLLCPCDLYHSPAQAIRRSVLELCLRVDQLPCDCEGHTDWTSRTPRREARTQAAASFCAV